jgi:hypothetical protein
MNRLQNAQKLLGDSLAALESAVAQTQLSTSPVGNNDDNSHDGNDGNDGLATTPSMDLGQLSQDVTAIEADLDKAIQMLAELTAQHPTGDGA